MKHLGLLMIVLLAVSAGVAQLDPNAVIAGLDTGKFSTYGQAQLAVFEQTKARNWAQAKRLLDAIAATPYDETVKAWAERQGALVQRDILNQELRAMIEAGKWKDAQIKYNEILDYLTAEGLSSKIYTKIKQKIPKTVLDDWQKNRAAAKHTAAYALLDQAQTAIEQRNKDVAIKKIVDFYQSLNENNAPFLIDDDLKEQARRTSRPVFELLRHSTLFKKRHIADIRNAEGRYLGPGEIKLSAGRDVLGAYRAFHPSLHGYRIRLDKPMTPHPLGRDCREWMGAIFYEPYNIKQIDIYNSQERLDEGISRIQVGVYAEGRWTNLGQFDIPQWSGTPVTLPVNIENVERVAIEVKQTMSDVVAEISFIGVKLQ